MINATSVFSIWHSSAELGAEIRFDSPTRDGFRRRLRQAGPEYDSGFRSFDRPGFPVDGKGSGCAWNRGSRHEAIP